MNNPVHQFPVHGVTELNINYELLKFLLFYFANLFTFIYNMYLINSLFLI